MSRSKILLAIAGAASIAAVVLGLGWFGLIPPQQPANLPGDAFLIDRLKEKELALSELNTQYLREDRSNAKTRYDLQKKYGSQIDQLVGADATPEDLALLALWAHREEHQLMPTEKYVLYYVFFNGIDRLGKLKGDRAKYALWKVKEDVVKSGQYDGAYCAELEEAAKSQREGFL